MKSSWFQPDLIKDNVNSVLYIPGTPMWNRKMQLLSFSDVHTGGFMHVFQTQGPCLRLPTKSLRSTHQFISSDALQGFIKWPEMFTNFHSLS